MADYNDFSISLGGEIDAESVNLSIKNIESKINPIKLKVEFDTTAIDTQIKNIQTNLSKQIASSKTTTTSDTGKTTTNIALNEAELDKIRTSYDSIGNAISETKTYIDDLGNSTKSFYQVATDGSRELVGSITTENTGRKESLKLAKQNEQLAYKLETAIRSYQNQGKISEKQTQNFNEKLQDIKASTDEIEKNKGLKTLNEDIKEAANSTGLLGQSFSKAMIKYTTWLGIATIIAQLTRAIKSLINEVVELDKALTSLQMVTGYTDTQMEDLKDTLIDMSKELGVTVNTLISGADEWMRAGLSAADTMEALRASTVMATIANMDNATATKYLIAQMNAYGLEANELIDIVDKMSAIDIVAATSTEELGEALSLSANSAQLAGIEYDKYLAMIATVSETTRQSASTIGNSFRSIFTRLQAVSLGSLVDEEGEDISQVDTLLKNYGIDLMEVTNNLSNMGALLDLLGARWDSYTTAQQSEIATTIAGNYQRERFIALMEEWDRVLELEQVSLESSGSAMDKYSVYQGSIEAGLNRLSSAWTELADATINSDWIKWLVDFATGFLELSTQTGGLANTILGLASAFVVLRNVIKTFQGGSFGLSGILGIIGGAVSGIIAIVNAVRNAQEEARKRALEIAQQNVQSAQEQVDAVEDLRQEYISLASTIEKTDSTNTELGNIKQQLIDIYGEEANALDLVNGKYEEQIGIIDELAGQSLEKQEEALTQQYNALMKQYEATLGQIGEASWTWERFETFVESADDPLSIYNDEAQRIAKSIAEELESATDPSERLEVLQRWYNEIAEMDSSEKDVNTVLNRLGEEIEELRPIVEQLEEVEAAIGEVVFEQEYLDSPLRDMVIQFEKDLASLEGMTEEQQRQMVASIEAQAEAIRGSELYETYKQFIDDILESGDDWIENIKTQDYLLTELDKKLSALQKQKELDEEELEIQEKLLKVEKAREELAKAKQQRIRVYRAGPGFVYEEDVEAVQEANEALQEAIQDASQTDLDKAIAGVQELQEMYNQAQLDQAAAGRTDLRDYFVDPDNVNEWLAMSFAQKKAFLDSFITTRDWNAPLSPESILNWVPTNAGGNKNFKGGPTWVGERGPELVNLPKGSEIMSNKNSLRLSSILNNPSKYLSGANGGVTLQFNGALNFPNVRDSSDANGFINALLQIGKNSIPKLT